MRSYKTLQATVLLFACLIIQIKAYAIRPTPTPSTDGYILKHGTALAKPTDPPQLGHRAGSKRDLDDTLSLYQNWAKVCNSNNDKEINDKLQDIRMRGVDDPEVRKLWQTVTSTVYCGNGHVKTVTTTITTSAKPSATAVPSGNGSFTCDDTCWSDYLWHTYGYGVSAAQGFTGTVLMLLGIYFLLFGYRFFRSTLGLVGFVFFAAMTWIGLVNNEPPFGYTHNEIVYVCVPVGLGIVGAILFIFVYPIAIYFVGGLGGYFLAVFILSWKSSLVIQIEVARICFIVGLGVVMAILVFMIESYTIIFCTAFIGGYLLMLGLDLFIHTGFVNSWLLIFDGNSHHNNAYIMKVPLYVMLSFIIVFTLISIGWQYYWNIMKLQRYFGINVVPAKEKVVIVEEKN
ncbi:hypothetical protein F4703DRAFT_1936074 [Phycomyces blakesleeanus]